MCNFEMIFRPYRFFRVSLLGGSMCLVENARIFLWIKMFVEDLIIFARVFVGVVGFLMKSLHM